MSDKNFGCTHRFKMSQSKNLNCDSFLHCFSLRQASSRRGSTREWCMETRGVYLGRWMIARKRQNFGSLGSTVAPKLWQVDIQPAVSSGFFTWLSLEFQIQSYLFQICKQPSPPNAARNGNMIIHDYTTIAACPKNRFQEVHPLLDVPNNRSTIPPFLQETHCSIS